MANLEAIQTSQLLKVLEIVKGMKSEFVCIPRMFTKNMASIDKVCGISDNAICHVADLDEMMDVNGLSYKPLWANINLSHIVLMTKEINPFIKLIMDYSTAKAIKDNRLGNVKKVDPMLIEQAMPMLSFLTYDTMEINGSIYAIGRQLYTLDHNNQVMENLAGNNTLTRTLINLYPEYIVLDPVQKYNILWLKSHSVCEYTDISSDQAFLDILALKAGDGARIWCPDVVKYGDNLKPYVFYINKTILNNVKGDKIYLSIHDQLEGMDSRYFMVKLDVVKTKKKVNSIYSVYVMCIKVA